MFGGGKGARGRRWEPPVRRDSARMNYAAYQQRSFVKKHVFDDIMNALMERHSFFDRLRCRCIKWSI